MGSGELSMHCIALHCIALHCIVLYCIVLYCIVLYCTKSGFRSKEIGIIFNSRHYTMSEKYVRRHPRESRSSKLGHGPQTGPNYCAKK